MTSGALASPSLAELFEAAGGPDIFATSGPFSGTVVVDFSDESAPPTTISIDFG